MVYIYIYVIRIRICMYTNNLWICRIYISIYRGKKPELYNKYRIILFSYDIYYRSEVPDYYDFYPLDLSG